MSKNFDEEKRSVEAWIQSERDLSFTRCPYGCFVRGAWGKQLTGGDEIKAATKNFPPAFANYFGLAWDEVFSGEGLTDGNVPGYHGILKRALKLVQESDRAISGAANERVVVTTLPTNQRYAAIYEPFVAPGWSVIALDWGMICAVIGLAVCFSECATVKSIDNGVAIGFGPAQLDAAVKAHPTIAAKAAKFLIPAIIASNYPPQPLLFDAAPERNGVATLIINALLFCIVAHEYGHLSRRHLDETQANEERRFQIEHEADGMAIVFALKDPWAKVVGEENAAMPLITASSYAFLLSFLGMLEIGDQMARDFGFPTFVAHTHPPPQRRLQALQQIFTTHLKISENVVRKILEYEQGFLTFGDCLWNKASKEIFAQLEKGYVSLQPYPPNRVSGARLMFL
jgi:hypothetical protein